MENTRERGGIEPNARKRRWKPNRKQRSLLERIFQSDKNGMEDLTEKRVVDITAGVCGLQNESAEEDVVTEEMVIGWIKNRQVRERMSEMRFHLSALTEEYFAHKNAKRACVRRPSTADLDRYHGIKSVFLCVSQVEAYHFSWSTFPTTRNVAVMEPQGALYSRNPVEQCLSLTQASVFEAAEVRGGLDLELHLRVSQNEAGRAHRQPQRAFRDLSCEDYRSM
ncbi:hypothetical protein KP509_28G049000 [Ceratopteris richardii]|uniref:Uncharacterized protein n=1 Tax=Ceratopteris richardii TaxID=49495 RepID=A0A8T2RBV8_CERRI|nr:hypothetical protein KP509_28G049000 [Ceratopteris richardii]